MKPSNNIRTSPNSPHRESIRPGVRLLAALSDPAKTMLVWILLDVPRERVERALYKVPSEAYAQGPAVALMLLQHLQKVDRETNGLIPTVGEIIRAMQDNPQAAYELGALIAEKIVSKLIWAEIAEEAGR